MPRRIASAILLFYTVGTHLTPLVMISPKPNLSNIFPALVFRNFRRRQVAVIVNNRHLFSKAMIKFTSGFRRQKKIISDK
jgi:hypothetical protein